jgi:hypothetical protein
VQSLDNMLLRRKAKRLTRKGKKRKARETPCGVRSVAVRRPTWADDRPSPS